MVKNHYKATHYNCERNEIMEFSELILKRFSVREFDGRKVERDKIEKILNAGQAAPTACNRQPQRIFVIESDDGVAKFRKCTLSHYNAPLAILVCFDKDECWKREYDGKPSGDIDASIVCTHMMLAAADLGIGSTWVMHYIPEAVKAEFSLPDNFESVALLVMGYPKEDAKPNPLHYNTKPLTDTVKFL